MTYQNPNLLIQTQELNSLLDTNTVKIFDTAVYLHPQPGGTYQVESGRSKYEDAHIPGAGFIDLVDHWADTTSPLRFTLPTPGALAQAIGEAGISPNDHVVLYSNGHLMWATRAFWLLRHAGHKKLSILNGNFTAWQQAGLPVAQGEVQFESKTFSTLTNLLTTNLHVQ